MHAGAGNAMAEGQVVCCSECKSAQSRISHGEYESDLTMFEGDSISERRGVLNPNTRNIWRVIWGNMASVFLGKGLTENQYVVIDRQDLGNIW